MSMQLQFGDDTLATVSGLSVKRDGITPRIDETWHVEMEVVASTPVLLEQAVQALRDIEGDTRDLKLVHDGVVVRELLKSDHRNGPVLLELKEKDENPGAAHNCKRVTLVFSATVQDAGVVVQSHEYTVQVDRDAGRSEQLVTRGRLVLRAGEAPADHEQANLPPVSNGYRRVRQTATRDLSTPALEYEVVDELVFANLPDGVDDGHFVVSETLTQEGQPLRTVKGFFVGAAALSRARAMKPDSEHIVSQRVDENAFTHRVDFEFTELLESTEAIASMETLSFTTTRRVVDHPLLGQSLPVYRQQVGSRQTEVVQEGSAIGHGRHPSPPQPRYPADLVERRVEYSVPHPGLPSNRRWVTSWRYVSRATGEIRGEA